MGPVLVLFRNVYRLGANYVSHVFTLINSTNMYQICTYYVLGTKANTRDTVFADVVLMVWLGRQTIRIHIMGSTIQEKNRV